MRWVTLQCNIPASLPMINLVIHAAYSLVLVIPNPNINFIQIVILFIITIITLWIHSPIHKRPTKSYVMQHFIIVLNHSVFHFVWLWKSISFELNNTIIPYKHGKVFNIPQAMPTFVDLIEYFDLHPKHQIYLTRGQQCVWFYQKWLCILQHTESMGIISLYGVNL